MLPYIAYMDPMGMENPMENPRKLNPWISILCLANWRKSSKNGAFRMQVEQPKIMMVSSQNFWL
jgi:hypothetical protein